MGQHKEFVCHTCKKRFYLGYVHTDRWERISDIIQEQHAGHKGDIIYTEYTYTKGNDLYDQVLFGGTETLLIKDWASYERIEKYDDIETEKDILAVEIQDKSEEE